MGSYPSAGVVRGELLKALLLVAAYHVLSATGLQVGVSLMFHGEVLPNDSFVDLEDIMYTGPSGSANPPSNRNPRDEALKCVTDLVDCCGTESGTTRTVHGDWYPDVVTLSGGGGEFRVNRGPNEVIDGSRVYGSVRIYRHYTPRQIGRYRCELPNAADPSVNQTLYANILNFGLNFDVDQVTISPSTGSATAGETYSLTCSSTLFQPSRLPSGLPSPNFQWSFNGSASLPSGVTAMPTILSSSNATSETYASMLQFSSISQCHAGMYTCRLGAGRLVKSAMVAVDEATVPPVNISVQITANGNKMVGQSGYSLTCGVTVTGAENTSFTYQWTKSNATHTQIQVGTDRVLSFSPLRLSDAGRYTCTCLATVSPCSFTKMDTHDVTLVPAPTSVMLSSSIPNPIPPFGSTVTLTCTVELSPAVDAPVTVKTVLTNPDGSMTTSTAQPVMGSITNYAAMFTISSFRRNNSGLYTCRAIVSLTSTNAYISDSSTVRHSIRVTTGVYLALRGVHIINNSNINIRNIGQTSDNPNGALQCVTDNASCCSQFGDWYLRNGQLVQETISTTAFYRSRGDNGEVSLNRPSGVESPTGLFCCEVPDAISTNQTLCVNIVPESTVSIHSNTPNPILSGSSLTLTCTAEMKSKVTVPLAISMELTGPDGTVFAPSTRPEMISFTLYSSSYTLGSVESTDSGEYTCIVKTESGPEVYASTNIIIGGMFQLRLRSVGICQQWYSESSDRSEQYSSFIKEALIEAIERRCKCRFPITNLLNEDLFNCEDSPNLMVYRNAVMGTLNFNGTQIIGFIQDWVSTEPLIDVDGNSVRVDSSCPTAISSLDQPVCREKEEEECLCENNPKYAMCAQHLDDNNVVTCFEGCIARNG